MNEPHSENEVEDVSTEANSSRDAQEEDSSLSQNISASIQFTGPIPPPIILEQYNRILPDAANRILAMAEREQEHRHKMQEKLIDSQVLDQRQERTERRVGQNYGLTIGIVAIISGSITAILGSSLAGGFIGSAGVIGLVAVFVLGRREQQNSQSTQLDGTGIENEPGSV